MAHQAQASVATTPSVSKASDQLRLLPSGSGASTSSSIKQRNGQVVVGGGVIKRGQKPGRSRPAQSKTPVLGGWAAHPQALAQAAGAAHRD